MGWDRLYIYALNVYICLNILFFFPKLWDPEAMKGQDRESGDYRCTAMYQRMLHSCTHCHTISQVATYPHRQFFGISDDQFRSHTTNCGGQLAFQDFLRSDGSNTSSSRSFMPSILNIYNVEETLKAKGLPTEIAWQVLGLTEYDTPKRRLKVAHHPFHHDNREELQKYLQYCWQILVRCNMMAKALQVEIDWKYLVARCLKGHFSSPGGEHAQFS